MFFNFAKEKSSGYNCLGTLFNHKSSQKKQLIPSLICTIAKPLEESSSFRISLHQKDPFFLVPGRVPLLQCFSQTNWTQGMSSLLKNLWRCLSKRASFCVLRFKTPKPPSFLGKQTCSQAAFGGCFALMSAPLQRQYFLYFNDRLMKTECAYEVRWYMGKAVKIAFVTSSRPAWERKLEVHASLLSHLVTKGKKSIIFCL